MIMTIKPTTFLLIITYAAERCWSPAAAAQRVIVKITGRPRPPPTTVVVVVCVYGVFLGVPTKFCQQAASADVVAASISDDVFSRVADNKI